jgi:hypothetical protein
MSDFDSILQQQAGNASTSDGANNPSTQSPMPQGGGLGSIMQRIPEPTHAETVAGLTHLTAIENGLITILNSPKCGRENIRPDAYNEASKLTGKGHWSIPQAMNELQGFPESPIDQRRFIERKLMQVQAARNILLMGRARAAQNESPLMTMVGAGYSADTHHQHKANLMAKLPSPRRQ